MFALMTRFDSALRFELVAVTLLAAVGCGGSTMAAPTDIGEKMLTLHSDGRDGDASEGEDASFDLGPYQIRGVKRDLTFKRGFDDLDGFKPAAQRGYRFKVKASGREKLEYTGHCAERAKKTIEDVDGSVSIIEEDAALACVCEGLGTDESRFYVEDLGGQYLGPISIGGVSARVVASYELDNGGKLEGRPAGFRVEDEEGTVAAADVLPGDSEVWLRGSVGVQDQARLVCALVGLMLWVPPAWPEPDED